MGELLLRLAHHCLDGQRYHSKPLNHNVHRNIWPNGSTRCIVGRRGSSVHMQSIPRLLTPVGHSPQKVYTSLSPKQWEGRGNIKGYEEDTQSSVDRVIFELVCAMPNPHTVSQHTISESWAFTSPKAIWPAQKLYGHPIQDTFPIHQQAFLPEWQHNREETEGRTQQSQDAAAARYNFTANSLPDITVGTNVAVQNTRTGSWDTYGLVTFIGPHRQYHVHTARGKILVWNRRFLRRLVPGSIPTEQRQNEALQTSPETE